MTINYCLICRFISFSPVQTNINKSNILVQNISFFLCQICREDVDACPVVTQCFPSCWQSLSQKDYWLCRNRSFICTQWLKDAPTDGLLACQAKQLQSTSAEINKTNKLIKHETQKVLHDNLLLCFTLPSSPKAPFYSVKLHIF